MCKISTVNQFNVNQSTLNRSLLTANQRIITGDKLFVREYKRTYFEIQCNKPLILMHQKGSEIIINVGQTSTTTRRILNNNELMQHLDWLTMNI